MTDPRLAPTDRVVIIGAGHGGVQMAHSLRENGLQGPIVLLDQEAGLPYHRPPLSKSVLEASVAPEPPLLRAEAFYSSHEITVRRDTPAVRLDRHRRLVHLATGVPEPYDHVVLATGSRARSLPVPGIHLGGVTQVRTLSDAVALRALLVQPGQRVAVVGGGYIGLEVAAAASGLGHHVTVIEGAGRLLARSVSPEVSDCVLRFHADRGCRVELNSSVVAFTGDAGVVRAVELASGESVPADLVVVGVGGIANSELAVEAGLQCCEVTHGIVVDDWLRTGDTSVSAIGDCATFPSRFADGQIRLESVQNAVDQARYAAARLIHGSHEPYNKVPWFWTDQADLKVQSVGVARHEESRVVLGSATSTEFSVLRFHHDFLVAVDSVNRPADHMAARRILSGGRRPTPAVARTPGFELKAFLLSA